MKDQNLDYLEEGFEEYKKANQELNKIFRKDHELIQLLCTDNPPSTQEIVSKYLELFNSNFDFLETYFTKISNFATFVRLIEPVTFQINRITDLFPLVNALGIKEKINEEYLEDTYNRYVKTKKEAENYIGMMNRLMNYESDTKN